MAIKRKIIFNNIDNISSFVEKKLHYICKKAIKKRKICAIGLSGGKTAERLYRKLSKTNYNLDWNKIHIFQIDERFVPPNDKNNNFRMIEKNLLKKINIPKKNIHRIFTEEKLEKSVKLYKKEIIRFFNIKGYNIPKLDLVLLGIGKDGHTASLFPDPTFKNSKNDLVLATYCKATSNHRISLTIQLLNAARYVVFIVTGKAKRKILQKIFRKNNILPAALIKPKKGKLYFLLDKAAV